ncbi:MAG: hypothetical protein ACTS3T_14770 [Almyronema sp.]
MTTKTILYPLAKLTDQSKSIKNLTNQRFGAISSKFLAEGSGVVIRLAALSSPTIKPKAVIKPAEILSTTQAVGGQTKSLFIKGKRLLPLQIGKAPLTIFRQMQIKAYLLQKNAQKKAESIISNLIS